MKIYPYTNCNTNENTTYYFCGGISWLCKYTRKRKSLTVDWLTTPALFMEKVMLAALVFPAVFQRAFQSLHSWKASGKDIPGSHDWGKSFSCSLLLEIHDTTGFCSVFISMYSLCKAIGFFVTTSCTSACNNLHHSHLFYTTLFYMPSVWFSQ